MTQSSALSLGTTSSPLAPPLPRPFPASIALVNRERIKDQRLDVLEGSIPADLTGHAYFIGPGGFINSPELGSTGLIHPSCDGTPLFNGDPLLHRLDFSAREVVLNSNIIRTPCFYTDQACLTDPQWYEYRYRNTGLARLSFRLGFRNEINTAVIPMRFNDHEGNRLLLTWDAGRPFEIDPVDLEIATAVGFDKEWKEQIALPMPFGIVTTPAHPVFDSSSGPDQQGPRLFTLNYGKSIGTSLHPIKSGYVDAPFKSDKQLIKSVQRLTTITQVVVTGLLKALIVLRKIESMLPSRIIVRGKIITRIPLRPISRLFALPPDSPQELTLSAFVSRLAVLLDRSLEQEIATQGVGAQPLLDSSLAELDRLIKVLSRLIEAPEKMEDFVHLISWDGEQPLQKWKVLVKDETTQAMLSPRIMQSMHQLGVTQDYLVLMDTVFKLGAEQLLTSPAPDFPVLERMIRRLIDFRQSDNTVLYLIKRSDLNASTTEVVAKQIVIPRGTAHFLLDYINPNNQITLHCVHNTGWDAAEWVRPFDQFEDTAYPGIVGMATGSTDVNLLARYVIDAEQGAVIESKFADDPNKDLTWMLALNAVCQPDGVTPPDRIKNIFWNGWGSHGDLLPEYIQKLNHPAKHRNLPVDEAVKVAALGLPGTLLRLDTETMTIEDQYVFPAGRFGNSVQFIPRPGAQAGGDDGYLMCIINGSDDPKTSEFWLFDAQNLSSGPVCCFGHESVKVGMTIHSTWVPEISNRSATYRVPVEQDYNEKLDTIERKDELLPLFKQYVYPNF